MSSVSIPIMDQLPREIGDRGSKAFRGVTKLAQTEIAGHAQKTANLAGPVVVVNVRAADLSEVILADGAPIGLTCKEVFVRLQADPVATAQIVRKNSIGVFGPPLPNTLLLDLGAAFVPLLTARRRARFALATVSVSLRRASIEHGDRLLRSARRAVLCNKRVHSRTLITSHGKPVEMLPGCRIFDPKFEGDEAHCVFAICTISTPMEQWQ